MSLRLFTAHSRSTLRSRLHRSLLYQEMRETNFDLHLSIAEPFFYLATFCSCCDHPCVCRAHRADATAVFLVVSFCNFSMFPEAQWHFCPSVMEGVNIFGHLGSPSTAIEKELFLSFGVCMFFSIKGSEFCFGYCFFSTSSGAFWVLGYKTQLETKIQGKVFFLNMKDMCTSSDATAVY